MMYMYGLNISVEGALHMLGPGGGRGVHYELSSNGKSPALHSLARKFTLKLAISTQLCTRKFNVEVLYTLRWTHIPSREDY